MIIKDKHDFDRNVTFDVLPLNVTTCFYITLGKSKLTHAKKAIFSTSLIGWVTQDLPASEVALHILIKLVLFKFVTFSVLSWKLIFSLLFALSFATPAAVMLVSLFFSQQWAFICRQPRGATELLVSAMLVLLVCLYEQRKGVETRSDEHVINPGFLRQSPGSACILWCPLERLVMGLSVFWSICPGCPPASSSTGDLGHGTPPLTAAANWSPVLHVPGGISAH